MRSRIVAVLGTGVFLASSLGLAPVALADSEHGRDAQVPVIVCKPTSNSYSVSLANTNLGAPLQTITETIASALGVHLVNVQDTDQSAGSSTAISACRQLAAAQQQGR
ncbi:MAG TPA: hypothetical protein VFD01_15660 [Candidatus Dormibacteraeota bacterium]|nr:hypothetical protein [Candidatus Dormibacteraeota bacterium]